VDALLGVHVPLQEMEAILKRLDFQVRISPEGEWDVLPPVYRLDVSIPEDVAEEVGRMYGYDKVQPTLPGSRRTTWEPATPSVDRRLDPVRSVLTGAGYTEVVTPALTSGALLDRLGVGELAMRVVNPVADDQDALRTTLLPSLLQVAAHNRDHGRPAVSVFETARAYLRTPEGAGAQPSEPLRLGGLRTGLSGDAEAGRVAFLEMKGALERALDVLAPLELSYEHDQAPLFHPGRCARVLVCGRPAGHVGELHPTVLAAFDLEGRAVALELELEPVLQLVLEVRLPRRARPLPRFPAVNRDLGVVVDESVTAAELTATIEAAGGDLLESATAFDEYRGSQVPDGRKSVAFALTFRSSQRTLTDAEVDQRMEAIKAALRERHGAAFRD
jgi:phenylalanyl-tRNA synthetase beta chain